MEWTFGSTDLQKATGATGLQIARWVDEGAIVPVVNVEGRGKSRRFNKENIIEAMICKALSAYSIEKSHLAEILSLLRKSGWLKGLERFGPEHPNERYYLLISKERVTGAYVVSIKEVSELEDYFRDLRPTHEYSTMIVELSRIVRNALP